MESTEVMLYMTSTVTPFSYYENRTQGTQKKKVENQKIKIKKQKSATNH